MRDSEFFRSRIPEFVEAERRFFSGEMDAKTYKGISGRFGSYAQRGGELGMIRLRMCGGHMDRDKLSFIIDECRRYGVSRIHTTTCETVQLHNLKGDEIAEIMDRALDHGINTQGGGGDNPRNVSATSLSGVEPGENFDVYPYAKAAETYLLDIMPDVKMPRKLKVTFSSSPRNETHATFRDLGFVSRPDGRFDVWGAGGLGNNPKFGMRLAEGVDPSKVLYHVRAMVDTFMEHGDYENRGKARTRYMRDRLGDELFAREYGKHLSRLLEAGGMDIHPAPSVFPLKEILEVSGERIHRQSQEGLYYVEYHPVGGDVPLEMLERIRDAIADADGAEVRVSPDSALYIINLDGEEAVRVRDATEGGSGCPSSCGCHQVGIIGLQGASKTVDGQAVPAFKMSINGCGAEGRERMGEEVGTIAQDRIPEMVVALGKAVRDSGKCFDEWLSSNDIRQVLADYIA